MTKERPILFSAPMVRAILAGSKTQTRRIVKMPASWDCFVCADWGNGWWPYKSDDGENPSFDNNEVPLNCPYGIVGDHLWVRETWSSDFSGHYPFDRVWYAADDDRKHDIERRDGVRGIYSPESAKHIPFKWHPSIHMPRAASRIDLEVAGVRVERLQDISEEDAQAEGCLPLFIDGQGVLGAQPFYRYGFEKLWQSINGAESWDANPWVWVVEFRRVTP